MYKYEILGLIFVAALAPAARAGEAVKASDSHTRFAPAVVSQVEDQNVRMVLTP
jgi:hypothetical protein